MVHGGFTAVVAQIVILDAVFSPDSVITAIGMVDNINVMMVAMVASDGGCHAVGVKPLMTFCKPSSDCGHLVFKLLLLIGISLIAGRFRLPHS